MVKMICMLISNKSLSTNKRMKIFLNKKNQDSACKKGTEDSLAMERAVEIAIMF